MLEKIALEESVRYERPDYSTLGKLRKTYDYLANTSVTQAYQDAKGGIENIVGDYVSSKINSGNELYDSVQASIESVNPGQRKNLSSEVYQFMKNKGKIMKNGIEGVRDFLNKNVELGNFVDYILGEKNQDGKRAGLLSTMRSYKNKYASLANESENIFGKTGYKTAQAGFTLVELLVVIGIIGVLAGMLMPALNKARAKAKVAVCQSQMKQIGTGLAMYANDNNDCRPQRWDIPVSGFLTALWDGVSNNDFEHLGFLIPQIDNGGNEINSGYLDNHKILWCPDTDGNNYKFTIDSDIFGYSEKTTGDRRFGVDNKFTRIPYTYRDMAGWPGPPWPKVWKFKHLEPTQAILTDMQFDFGSAGIQSWNHQNKYINILGNDAHVKSFSNSDGHFTVDASLSSNDYWTLKVDPVMK